MFVTQRLCLDGLRDQRLGFSWTWKPGARAVVDQWRDDQDIEVAISFRPMRVLITGKVETKVFLVGRIAKLPLAT